MLRDGLRALFDDRRRGDDRGVLTSDVAAARAGKPPVLRRWTIRLFAILGILAIVYGTLAPFQIAPGRTWSWNLRWHPLIPGDAAANVLVYVPIGVFLRLLLRRRGSWWFAECLGGLLLAAGLSYLTEACQTILAQRVPSWLDVYCNLAGAALGLAIAPIFQRVLRNHHAWLYAELRVRPFGAAASAAILLVAAAALLPFDLQPTPTHLAAGLDHIRHTPLSFPWTAADSPAIPLSPVQLFDKMAAAACVDLSA